MQHNKCENHTSDACKFNSDKVCIPL